MNYEFTCNTCKKKTGKISTHDAIKYLDGDIIVISFDCPNCGAEIKAEYGSAMRIPNK